MSRLSIYYGRIWFEEATPGQESLMPRNRLVTAVMSTTSVERYRHEWVLANLREEGEGRFVVGRLGYPSRETVVREDLDPERHEFVERSYELPHALSAPFVLDIQTEAIAFDGENIGPAGFVNHFVALLNATGLITEGRFRGELVRIAENYREFINAVDKITRVQFEVRPTNPRDKNIFRPLDQGMKAANAKRLTEVIENKEEGLRLVPPDSTDDETDNPAIQGIEMVEDGYGESYRIDAERDGRPLRFESRGGGLLKDVVEDTSDDPDVRAATLLEFLQTREEEIQPGHAPAPPFEPADAEQDEQLDAEEL